MDLIPPSDIQPWLKKKIALEEKIRQQEANSETASMNNFDEAQPRFLSMIDLYTTSGRNVETSPLYFNTSLINVDATEVY